MTCVDRCTEKFNTNQGVIGDTYSFSPTTIGDFRVAYLRFSYDRIPLTAGYDLSQLGWWTIVALGQLLEGSLPQADRLLHGHVVDQRVEAVLAHGLGEAEADMGDVLRARGERRDIAPPAGIAETLAPIEACPAGANEASIGGRQSGREEYRHDFGRKAK